MTRPLALIEGDLTIPLPRPFDGLPPPFGSRRNVLRDAVQHAVRQTKTPASARPFPPGVKHVLFYKAPPRRTDTHKFDALMAEAKHYLAASAARRPPSSRSDHVLAATIFAGCTIALTWLLVTCSIKDAEKAKPIAVTSAVLAGVSPRVDRPEPVSKAIVANKAVDNVALEKPTTPKIAAVASAAPAMSVAAEAPRVAKPVPVVPLMPKQAVRVTAARNATLASSEKAGDRVKVRRLSETRVTERVALSRATRPEIRPAPSTQPEWTASASRSHDDASSSVTPWINWAAQQHRPSPTMRAAVPVAGDNNWNDHMTQRRITDDPAAFHADRSGQ
ncbi:hypothetical protein PQR53_29150 [Paraburkholderia fungorum]|uniref:hypothetical protein n=1 Tax=Paraburkholderia fungorum TaxID=134537 RepID=UPI0038B737F9